MCSHSWKIYLILKWTIKGGGDDNRNALDRGFEYQISSFSSVQTLTTATVLIMKWV